MLFYYMNAAAFISNGASDKADQQQKNREEKWRETKEKKELVWTRIKNGKV